MSLELELQSDYINPIRHIQRLDKSYSSVSIKFILFSMLYLTKHEYVLSIFLLMNSESCQIVECAWLDWCNLITIQRTTKYKIRTKYDDNLRFYKNR
jgi:hypothetical protein